LRNRLKSLVSSGFTTALGISSTRIVVIFMTTFCFAESETFVG
jgi:hypothetical protein